MRRLFLALLLVLLASTGALGETYCVGDPVACTGVSQPDLAAALLAADANPGPDAVYLGAGTFSGNFLASSIEPLQVIGAGRGATTLTSASGTTLTAQGGVHQIRDMTIERAGGSATAALHLADGSIGRNLDLRVSGSGPSPRGLIIDDYSSLEDSTISTSRPSGEITLVQALLDSNPTLRRVQMTANGDEFSEGVTFDSSGAITLDRVQILNAAVGVMISRGTATVRNSLIRTAPANGAAAINVTNTNVGATAAMTLNITRSTLVASGVDQDAIQAYANGANHTLAITAHDTAFFTAGASTLDIHCRANAVNGGTLTLDLQRSAVREAGVQVDDACAFNGLAAGNNLAFTGATELVIAPAEGDYTPRAGSPLIDAGTPGALGGEQDLMGRTRVVDGTGDGSAIRDIGAFEYQRIVPGIPLITAASTSIAAGSAFSASALASDGDGEAVTIAWSAGDGSPPAVGSTLTHTYASPGTYVATAVATDPAGLSSQASVTVTVTPAPAVVPSPSAPAVSRPSSAAAPRRPAVARPEGLRAVARPGGKVLVTFRRPAQAVARWQVTFAQGSRQITTSVRTPRLLQAGLRPGVWQVSVVARAADGRTSAAARTRVVIRRAGR